ncbi:MAG: DUF4347 domain-containing protein [Cyanobacteria bacterium J06631_9]
MTTLHFSSPLRAFAHKHYATLEKRYATVKEESRNLVIIDAEVDEISWFLKELKSGYTVEFLSQAEDGIAQISEILKKYQNLQSLHLVSHGQPGAIQLGNTWLTADKLASEPYSVISWSKALATSANVFIYGCQVADGKQGKRFVALLQEFLGTSVFASKSLVGHSSLGGSWEIGANPTVQSDLAFDEAALQSYPAVLAAPSHTIAVGPQEIVQIGSDIDGAGTDDFAGFSVSLSAGGNIVAVGAFGNDTNGESSGHVRLYELVNGNWQQLGSDINGEAAIDVSGRSVSLSADGSTVAIGAHLNDGNGGNSGHVRLFQFSNGDWQQVGSDIDGEFSGDTSGISISLAADGSTVAIGATGNDGNGNSSGHVRLFQLNNGNWQQLGADINGEAANDFSGRAVSLSADGSIVAIGANGNDANGSNSGHVRLYELVNGSWQQLGNDIDGEASGDDSGISVALSADGSTVAVGATKNDGNGSNSGHVRLFQLNNGTWQQLGNDLDGEALGDEFGTSVSLSADGSTVAVGAADNDGNGGNSGHVRLFQWTAGAWQQIDSDIDGEAAGDESGKSVSLSANGRTVAIGADRNDGNGDNKGHVRIYGLESTTATVDEDTVLDLSGITVTDADGNLATTQLSVLNGILTVDLAGGASISAGENDSNTITLSGSEAEINAALDTLIYQGSTNFFGNDTLTITSTDTTGIPLSTSDTLDIEVTAVEDAPTHAIDIDSPEGSLNPTVEESTLLSLNGIIVSDAEGNLDTTQLSVINGVLNVDISGGATISAGSNGSAALALSGSEAQINAALTTLTYQGNTDFFGADTLTVTSTDSSGLSPSTTDTLTIDVTESPEIPTTVTLENGNLTITDSTGVLTRNNITITETAAAITVTDPTVAIAAGAGTTQIDLNTVEISRSAITGTITFDLLTGRHTVDASGLSQDIIVDGGNKIDTILGGDGADRLIGKNGADVLSGGNNKDIIRGGEGADTLDGGNDIDTVDYIGSASGVTVDLFAGTASGGDGEGDTLDNFERIYGSDHGDQLSGDGGNNFIWGRAGADVLNGGGGNDLLRGGEGADVLNGGSGNDVADYQTSTAAVSVNLLAGVATGGEADGDSFSSIEKVFGSAFDDSLNGDNSNNILVGNDGADSLSGLGGNDILRGGLGADTLDGGAGNDAVDYRSSASSISIDLFLNNFSGGDANGDTVLNVERIFASHFDDVIVGDANNNILYGYDGADMLSGGSGNDIIQGGAGFDVLDGGVGKDTLEYRQSAAGVVIDLSTDSASGGDAQGDTISNFERVFGSQFDDTLVGANDGNILRGNDGDDMLSGLGGVDRLRGGNGADTLLGGGGADIFELAALSESTLAGYDTIADLNANQDRIDSVSAIAPGSITQIGNINSLGPIALETALDSNSFTADSAAVFTVGSGQSQQTFIALNDDTAGFQTNNDAIIEITGFTGNLNNLQIV